MNHLAKLDSSLPHGAAFGGSFQLKGNKRKCLSKSSKLLWIIIYTLMKQTWGTHLKSHKKINVNRSTILRITIIRQKKQKINIISSELYQQMCVYVGNKSWEGNNNCGGHPQEETGRSSSSGIFHLWTKFEPKMATKTQLLFPTEPSVVVHQC